MIFFILFSFILNINCGITAGYLNCVELNNNFFIRAVGIVCMAFVCLIQANQVFAQKYTFAHYDIEDGLIQSQANRFSMDNNHRLWIGTFGGACRFDGKDFFGYSRQNGLPSNFVSAVLSDKGGRTWFGTLDGVAMLYNGKTKNYKPVVSHKGNVVTNIVQDGTGTVWVVMSYELFKITGDKMKPVIFDDSAKVTTIAIDSSGKLYAAVYKSGLYSFKNNKWTLSTAFKGDYGSIPVRKILFDRFDKQKTYLLAWNGLYYINNNEVRPYAPRQKFAEGFREPKLFPPETRNGGIRIQKGTPGKQW